MHKCRKGSSNMVVSAVIVKMGITKGQIFFFCRRVVNLPLSILIFFHV